MAEELWGLGSTLQYGFVSAAFLFGARLLYSLYNDPEPENCSYVPWSDNVPEDDTVAVDCTHPSLPTLSHHKGANNPSGVTAADTSTGIVLNALASRSSWSRDVAVVTHKQFVTTNHFDIDSFLSCWCYMNRKAALEHEGVLRHMARIGDFREAFLSPDLITAHGADDHITFIREAYTALKLCCWMNTLEKRLFSAPYESSDCTAKMEWFLPRFERVLRDPESAWGDWQQEYTKVVSGFDLLAGADCMVETPPGLGLAILSAPEPLHYYSLFSHTIGYDVVLMMYDDNRYEVEAKYTQFVVLASRPTWPRLDMAPLASVLNNFEAEFRSITGSSSSESQPEMVWVANSLTDTGPLLRLQPSGEKLTKAQRYGHPYERPIYSSAIPPSKMQALVQSFLGFGLQGLKPEMGGYSWQELHDINQQIHWQDWASCVLQQVSRNDLEQAASTAAAGRRRSLATSATFANSALASSPTAAAAPATVPPALSAELPQDGEGPNFTRGFTLPINLQHAGVPLIVTQDAPVLSQPSVVVEPAASAALAAALPALHRGNPWLLIYSTARDGISLATMMRKAEKVAPTLLLVKDAGGAVFGAYVTDAWRYSTRFYGTGESFVFQLSPQRLMWSWVNNPSIRNDFFQYVNQDGLGVGGAGHWAISLNEELLQGSSGPCDTFASPCLASREEFEIIAVELWHVH